MLITEILVAFPCLKVYVLKYYILFFGLLCLYLLHTNIFTMYVILVSSFRGIPILN
jgi:hypothetical protein